MNSASPSRGGSDTAAARQQSEPQQKVTPNTDMQPQDSGTADSGDADGDDSGTAATRAMKQTSKTAAESGDKR